MSKNIFTHLSFCVGYFFRIEQLIYYKLGLITSQKWFFYGLKYSQY